MYIPYTTSEENTLNLEVIRMQTMQTERKNHQDKIISTEKHNHKRDTLATFRVCKDPEKHDLLKSNFKKSN